MNNAGHVEQKPPYLRFAKLTPSKLALTQHSRHCRYRVQKGVGGHESFHSFDAPHSLTVAAVAGGQCGRAVD
jgi:hypothetical protein